jgi:hypothetical protein
VICTCYQTLNFIIPRLLMHVERLGAMVIRAVMV